MSVPFNIAHTINGRTRIRWAGDDKDKHHVIEIAAQLNEIEAIDAAIAICQRALRLCCLCESKL